MSRRALYLWLGLWSALYGALGCSFDTGANDARGCDQNALAVSTAFA